MNNATIAHALQSIVEAAAAGKDIQLLNVPEEAGLQQCPFCGGSARLRCEDRPDPPARYQVLFVRCLGGGAMTKEDPTGNYYGVKATPEEEAPAWNKRADTSP